jgi:F-type H+-transporting ATPase subunit delta
MSTRSSATRYARALLQVALAESDPARVERDLASFVDALKGSRDLRIALTTPSVPAPGKRGIVEAVAARLDMAPPAAKLLALLAGRDRLGLADDLLAAFRDQLLDHQKIVRAEIRSATALPSDAIRAIEARLSAVTGKNVSVESVVDAGLIGGVLAKVGSTVYDGTVKMQLEKLRKQLVGAGD